MKLMMSTELGQAHVFEELDAHGIFALPVLNNVDDPMILFFVPFDMNDSFGPHDVALNPYLTARCGRGFWIHEDDIKRYGHQSGGVIPPEIVSAIQEKLGDLVNGVDNPTDLVENNEWMDVVTRAVAQLEYNIHH